MGQAQFITQSKLKEAVTFINQYFGSMLETHQSVGLRRVESQLPLIIGMTTSPSGCILSNNIWALHCSDNIHAPKHFFRSQEIKIRAGKSYHLKIIPTLHQSTPEFMGLSIENRNCSLTSEVKGDSIFNSYSQKGCIFECTLKKIVSKSKYVKCLSHT